ncbi:motility protein A [Rhizorhabdus dicambivorans]|uniref:Flagellar motor protein n=1 Tax=Rhizorhabdus dicambivorans TaxID=1850238 RepID=A0A2A4FUY6_9SPHN|nr:MotA/TolQ/ExbB proton channel family protein [Rhizorhabdus dicambivorans]ATE64448.1 flagellar motor protein [Rhizorhabdus dicambivorans]PCE41201.1 flagellar motor protein [Rhizorhabdus dicambivorans]
MVLLDAIARYIDPVAIGIVFGGTLLTTVFRSPLSDIGRAFGAFGLVAKANPDADAAAARVSVSRIRELAQVRAIACVDRVETAQRFLIRAARELSEARNSGDFVRWAAADLDARRLRHQGVIGVWRGVAETAPAMGMIGTIIGLVQMFSHMEDAAAIGPAMAVAMLTTLYGVLISAGIAAPIAGRLETISEAELAWQAAACKQLEILAREELDSLPQPIARPNLRTVL